MISIDRQNFNKNKKFSKIYFEKLLNARVIGFIFQDSTVIPFENVNELDENVMYFTAATKVQPYEIIKLKNVVKVNQKHYEITPELMNEIKITYSVIISTIGSNIIFDDVTIKAYDDCGNETKKISTTITNCVITHKFNYAYVKTIIVITRMNLATDTLETYCN